MRTTDACRRPTEQAEDSPRTSPCVRDHATGIAGKNIPSALRAEATLLAVGIAQRISRVEPERQSTVKRLDRRLGHFEASVELVDRGLGALLGWWVGK